MRTFLALVTIGTVLAAAYVHLSAPRPKTVTLTVLRQGQAKKVALPIEKP